MNSFVFFLKKDSNEWKKVTYYVAIVTSMYIKNQLADVHSFRLKGKTSRRCSTRVDSTTQSVMWPQQCVAMVFKQSECSDRFFSGQVTLDGKLHRCGYTNTSCWLPWWQKQGEMKFTQTPEEHGHRGQTCGCGWEEKEVRRWTWGLFHLKPLTADQISSKRRDTMVQQLRRGGEVKGWVDQSRLRWMEGWAETNEDGGGKTEMGKKK